jgi:hypothetical protein
MPNGGPDNCGECWHNRVNQEQPELRENAFAEFCMSSYCMLRSLDVSRNPFWTYCANCTYIVDSQGGRRPPPGDRWSCLFSRLSKRGICPHPLARQCRAPSSRFNKVFHLWTGCSGGDRDSPQPRDTRFLHEQALSPVVEEHSPRLLILNLISY